VKRWTSALIYDWNELGDAARRVQLNDETLREGLQDPSVRRPGVQEQARLLHLMADLRIDAASIGMPVSGEPAYRLSLGLAEYAARERLPVRLHCAARTIPSDIAPVLDIAQRAGVPIDIMAFIGSSPIRMYAEGWDLRGLLRLVREAVRFSVSHGAEICLVTEDTTRAAPEVLRALYRAALDEGARRICLCDTVGHATPGGTRELVEYVRSEILGRHGFSDVPVDWHGHNDRGLGMANAIAAMAAGVDRVHGTALGLGERCGNSPMEQLLLNLFLAGDDRPIAALDEYCRHAAGSFDRVIAPDRPVVGKDAFRTVSGVHAAAIAKAESGHGSDLADVVYSGVPASAFGHRQMIGVGAVSGTANVRHWLRSHGLESSDPRIGQILEAARSSSRTLSDREISRVANAP
jgi:2-isopropylmalate synthase